MPTAGLLRPIAIFVCLFLFASLDARAGEPSVWDKVDGELSQGAKKIRGFFQKEGEPQANLPEELRKTKKRKRQEKSGDELIDKANGVWDSLYDSLNNGLKSQSDKE